MLRPLLVPLLLALLVPAQAARPPDPAASPFDAPSAVRLEDYLPSGSAHDDAVPRPATVLGHEIGAAHARHDLVVAWFRALARASDRVHVEEIGRTHEGRPQLVAHVSAPDHIADLDARREAHLANAPDAPLFTWHGYSVHGNEASGLQASMVVAWHLASSTDPEVLAWLGEAVILIDPSLNPDGYGRYATWANQSGGRMPVADPDHRSRAEPWPGGRTNHYFFDLNRDWLLLQHPESRNRLAFLRRHRPHVMTDHHEMGADKTFFFQPGLATRWHPDIPEANRSLTAALAEYHAAAFDRAGRLYYDGESFDDFYPGKGSTWPDLQGTVGILFEQAGVRGAARDTAQGRITFPMAIHNHVLVSLSTIRGAVALREELKAYRRDHDAGALVPDDLPAAWVFDDGGDPGRAAAMIAVLEGQGLEVLGVREPLRAGTVDFPAGRSWLVPLRGPSAALADALFETLTEFGDSTFYDVSAWSLPHAFGVRAAPLGRLPPVADLDPDLRPARPTGVVGAADAVAWILPWEDFRAPGALHRLQRAGVRTRVATEPFAVPVEGEARSFERGAVVVHAADVPAGPGTAADRLAAILGDAGLLVGVDSAYGGAGVDLGSPRVRPLTRARVALVAGDGVNGYAAGSFWHLLDHRLGMPVTLVRPDDLDAEFLDRHTHLLMVDGRYGALGDASTAALGRWIEAGGVLVTTRRAATWAQEQGWLPAPEDEDPSEREEDTGPQRFPYGEMADHDGALQLGGSVLAVDLDRTHPLAYGIELERIGLMRRGRIDLAFPEHDPFATVGVYPEAPLLNGYLPEGYAAEIAGRPAVLALPRGEGLVVAFADDPAFRAVWWVGQRMVANAIAFGEIVRAPREEY